MSTSTLRMPAVAGRFYPRRPDELLREVREYMKAGFAGSEEGLETSGQECPPHTAMGCIAPHAGYMYSGHVAGAVYAQLEVPRQCVVLCVNHNADGFPLAIRTR